MSECPLGEVIEQTLPLEDFFRPSERRWVILAVGGAPLPYLT